MRYNLILINSVSFFIDDSETDFISMYVFYYFIYVAIILLFNFKLSNTEIMLML